MELQDFEGVWRLDRRIKDRLASSEARFEGQAEWRPVDDGLAYLETGRLITAQGSFTAERRYLWRDGLQVYFEDGRFFHSVPLDGSAAVHHCDPDLYRVRYDFIQSPGFSATWQVSGPRKDYTMVSTYHPSD